MAEKSAFPWRGGTYRAYAVEASIQDDEPRKLSDGRIYGARWQQISITKAAAGVPSGPFHVEAESLGLVGYAQAQALRWWFIAANPFSYGMRTRLVPHEITYSIKAYAKEPIEDLSANELVPDRAATGTTSKGQKS
jgi:hypothetical protein